MELPSDLISQLVKVTTPQPTANKETIVYGTIRYDGKTWVQLDGSELYTPLSTTADVKDGDRVTVVVKDHTAIVTGNLSDPSASSGTVTQVEVKVVEMDNIIANKVSTNELYAEIATIEKLIISEDLKVLGELEAAEADIGKLEADNAVINGKLIANEAEFKKLEAEKLSVKDAEITFASIDNLKALNAEFVNLRSTYGTFEQLATNKFTATEADITYLNTEMFEAETGNIKFVKIDFANIDKAWMEEFYSRSGLVEYMTSSDLTVTGQLVGVTIKGDLIEGGTIIADKLVIRDDETGLLYKLNFECGNFTDAEEIPYDRLHGSVLVAESVTAEKISVDDLVAFGATIGGFHITGNSIYSRAKETVDSTLPGLHFGNDGQISLGDHKNYLRYVKSKEIYKRTGEIAEFGDYVPGVNPIGGAETDDGYAVYSGYYYNDSTGESGEPFYYTVVDETYFVVEYDSDGYKLEISADSILFGGGSNDSPLGKAAQLAEHIKMGTVVDTNPETGEPNEMPCIELGEGDSDFRQVITNLSSRIMEGSNTVTKMDIEGIETENLTVRNEIRQGQWAWVQHGRGNLGLMWKEVSS